MISGGHWGSFSVQILDYLSIACPCCPHLTRERDLANAASYFHGLKILGDPSDPGIPTFQYDVTREFFFCVEASAPVHTALHQMSTNTMPYNPTALTSLPTNMLHPGNGKAGNLLAKRAQPKSKEKPKSKPKPNGGNGEKPKPKPRPKPKAKPTRG